VLRLPDLPEAALPDYVQIIKQRLLYLLNLMQFEILKQSCIFLQLLVTLFLSFLLMICEMFGIFRFEPCFLLGVSHEIVSEFMVDVVKVDV
jgi:hypothetical protein